VTLEWWALSQLGRFGWSSWPYLTTVVRSEWWALSHYRCRVGVVGLISTWSLWLEWWALSHLCQKEIQPYPSEVIYFPDTLAPVNSSDTCL